MITTPTTTPVATLRSLPAGPDTVDPLDEWVQQWVDEEFAALVRDLEPSATEFPPLRAPVEGSKAPAAYAYGPRALRAGRDKGLSDKGAGNEIRARERAPPPSPSDGLE